MSNSIPLTPIIQLLKWFFIGAVFSLSLVLTACGGATSTPTPTPAPTPAPVPTPNCETEPDNPVCLPPNPADVASEIDLTFATTLFDSTAFIYAGENPIQTGVTPGIIDAEQVSILRGQVTSSDGVALAGVTITALNHGEYGQTKTRLDGWFDFAINGGGSIILQYARPGYLTSQRELSPRWQNYTVAPNVVLMTLDVAATPIMASSNTAQMAIASTIEDTDGQRQSRTLFKPGTSIEIVLPNGQVRVLDQAVVRATEYTVGENGPAAMPGNLPKTSTYTYAIELSLDEAIAAHSNEVRFSNPVINYTNNFLDFDVGGIVPAGYYDREQGRWIPSDNGRVIGIISTEGGVANVDISGDGQANTLEELVELGIDNVELEQLATNYQNGDELWRVPMNHFTPWDLNWGGRPPGGATNPTPFGRPAPDEQTMCTNTSLQSGSIIECQNQVLGESIEIPGTPYSLNYRSDRVVGRTAENILRIPITGPQIPEELDKVHIEVTVAGQQWKRVIESPVAMQSIDYIWDGYDVYGRKMNGAQPAVVRIGYEYQTVYTVPLAGGGGSKSFAQVTPNVSATPGRAGIILWNVDEVMLTPSLTTKDIGIGGWMLSVHHQYDPLAKSLQFGVGSQFSAPPSQRVVETIAGGELNNIGRITGVAVDRKNNVYYADTNQRVIWIKRPGEEHEVFAGTRNMACGAIPSECGDGSRADEALLGFPGGLTVGPDDSIYISSDHTIRKVTPDGIIHLVAGTGEPVHSGDEGLAIEASLDGPSDIAVTDDGSIYIAENHRIRHIDTEGVIRTVVGTGGVGITGEDGPALEAAVTPLALAVSPEGELYISEGTRVVKLTNGGLLLRVASIHGATCFDSNECGDGGLFSKARISVSGGMAFNKEGALYIAGNYRIRRVDTDGIVHTVAGGFHSDPCSALSIPDGELAVATPICSANNGVGLATGPDGSLYLSNFGAGHVVNILKFEAPLPGFEDTPIFVASPGGTQGFNFDSRGRHLSTQHALTGAELYRFSYQESSGALLSVTDLHGATTQIERDENGRPIAIVGPHGHRSLLSVDENGYLSSFITPAGSSYNFTYSPKGLLEGMNDPHGSDTSFAYDEFGRLTRDDDAVGGFKSLARTLSPGIHHVTLSTALERETKYDVYKAEGGSTRLVDTHPDGYQIIKKITDGGTTLVVQSNGKTSTTQQLADPRFGMQASFESSVVHEYPSGLLSQLTRTRSVESSSENLFDITTLTETKNVNGRTYTQVYDAATKTFTKTSPEGREISWQIDDAGKPLVLNVPGFEPRVYTYDELGRRVRSEQSERSLDHTYDTFGRVSIVTDASNASIAFTYDADDQITQVRNQTLDTTEFDYDDNGRNTILTTANNNDHKFTYTNLGQVQSYSPPEVSGNSRTINYEYDLDWDLTRKIDEDGRQLDVAYDDFGRVSSLTTPTRSQSFTYDETTKQLIRIASANSTLDFLYDGDLPISSQWSGDVEGTVSKTYDSNLWLTAITVNTEIVSFGYDNDGLLTSAGDMNINRHSEHGFIRATSLNNNTESYAYNAYGSIETQSAAISGADIYQSTYSYDLLGRVTTLSEVVDGDTVTKTYNYDNLGRLLGVLENGVAVETYSYDANGNRTSTTDKSGNFTAVYDAQDRIQIYGDRNFTFDASGRLQQTVQNTEIVDYNYDAIGNLLSVSLGGNVVSYIVDPRNRRIGKRMNGIDTKRWLYQNTLNPVAELNAEGEIVSRFIYGEKINTPAYMERDGISYSIISDHLGSVRLVVDSQTGLVVQRIDYNAFGVVTLDTNPGFQPFGFAGGMYDADTHLVRFGARDYDASIGRWLSKDPSGFNGGNPNLYIYVNANPVNFIDPEGKDIGFNLETFAKFFKSLLGEEGDTPVEQGINLGEKLVADTAKGCLTEAFQGFRGGLSKQFNNSGAGTFDYNRFTDSRDAGKEVVDALVTAKNISTGDTFDEKIEEAKATVKDFLFSIVGSMFGD